MNPNDFGAVNEKYQQVMKQDLEAAKNMINAMSEAYMTQLDFSVESNKKLLSELNKQMTQLMKGNEEFWTSVTKNYGRPVEKEKNTLPLKEEKKPIAAKKETLQHT
jgi:ribosomal protein S17E